MKPEVSRAQKRKYTNSESKGHRIVNWLLWVIMSVLSAVIVYYVVTYRLFNFKHLNTALYAVVAISLLGVLCLNLLKKAKKTVTVISILYCLVAGAGLYATHSLVSGFSQLQQSTQYTEQTMSVVVLKESPVTTIEQLNNKTVSAPLQLDKQNVETFVSHLKETKSVAVNVEDIASYTQAYDALIKGNVEAIVLNSSFEGILEQEVPDYTTKIRRVYEYVIKKEQADSQIKGVKPTVAADGATSFNLYISGIDTYGPISSVSRSDVNIIMTVNTKTGNILLTTTPRDAYVRIAGGGQNQYDKLTHAGIYGVQSSIDTLQNLYGTTINYYARINFTSFLKLIDVVGGVSVYNTQSFTSAHGGFYFPQGTVELDSDKALGFVRERYSLANGDVDRAANQQKVIEAIIKKLASPSMITQAGSIMSQLSDSLQTNMPFEVISDVINYQINHQTNLNIESQALRVTGQMGLPSYAMPGYNLYMGVVNESSLSDVTSKIERVLSE
ncbi:LCP family protein [Carnobacteriaceae bacterium zg-ZUI252]|nr:LCP family protein [Carnobacteriaceae bacterium zg-ZUI252]QTU83031.1 LCP family protein [Carnobacteriaceae bacterium zg-C25]